MMRGGSSGIGYGLKYQARCIADVKADTEHTTFIAGTLSLKEENEVHLIRLSSTGRELVCEGLFYHPNEIWHLASCPFNSCIFSTVFAFGDSCGAAIWEVPEADSLSSVHLGQLVALDAHTCKIKCTLWWPTGKHDQLISIDEENILLWCLDSSSKNAKVLARDSVGMLNNLSGGMWDPHDKNIVAGMCDSSIQFWDLRTMKTTSSIECAHARDADFDPKRQHAMVTAEDDSGVHIWDLRMPKRSVAELSGHTHWTWAVQYNPKYEKLILTSGTDSMVKLWSTPETESEVHGQHVDPLLACYDDYEDSVYGIAWSTREPGTFASLSYDGRVVVEAVTPYLS